MVKHIPILLGCFLGFEVNAQDQEIPCWMNPDTIPEISQVAVLKTHLLPIRLEKPKEDLALRLMHHDYRFIAIGGFAIEYPGLDERDLLCRYGFRFITGTSDAIESKEHGALVGAFIDYAKEYNQALEAELGSK